MPKSLARLFDFEPLLHVALADVPNIGTTPVTIHSLVLPAAGTYAVEASGRVETGTLGATRTATWSSSVTNHTSSATLYTQTRTGNHIQLLLKVTTNPAVCGFAMATGMQGRVQQRSIVTVSAASVLTVTLVMAADVITYRAGGFVRARWLR